MQDAGFEWDEHNEDKNRKKHGVEFMECEEIFFDENQKLFPDERHSISEKRLWILGRTRKGRYLFVTFTERRGKIRVVSARDMNHKERRMYHEKV